MSELVSGTSLIMIKPHALDETLDPLIVETLHGNYPHDLLVADDPLHGRISEIQLLSPIIRDLRSVPYGRKILEIFYANKSDRRYYPMIMREYLGRVAFIPFVYRTEDPSVLFENIKGSTETFDMDGEIVDRQLGIRGMTCKPYQFVSGEDSAGLNNQEFEELFLPVVNNAIHVSDIHGQTQAVMRILYPDDIRGEPHYSDAVNRLSY